LEGVDYLLLRRMRAASRPAPDAHSGKGARVRVVTGAAVGGVVISAGAGGTVVTTGAVVIALPAAHRDRIKQIPG